MLRKSQEEIVPSNNRIKLPTESGIRSLAGIKELQAMAAASRGCQIELEWTTNVPEQIFVLDVQWEAGAEDPFWSLYEEKGGQSKQLWTQSFAAAEVDLFYEVLAMSCGASPPTKNLADLLKPSANKDESSKASTNKPEQIPATGSSPNSNTAPNTDANVLGMPFNPAAGFPIQAYNVPPMLPPGAYQQMQQPPLNIPPPGWQYAPVAPANSNLYIPTANQAPSNALASLPIDSTLVNKQSDISLVDLLVEAELLSEPDLSAALKIQDLVKAEQLSMEKAAELLKRYHSKGKAIEDYIDIEKPSAQKDKSNSQAASNKNEPSGKSEPPDKRTLAALELMKQAGLLSDNDLKTAKGVSRKHGGDLISILKAAQKLDDNTLEAAMICHDLEKNGLMKVEQCVIVLNYCSRSRTTFDGAINELNWENPRQPKK